MLRDAGKDLLGPQTQEAEDQRSLMEPSEQRYDMSAYILYQNQTIPEKWGNRLEFADPAVSCNTHPSLRWWQDILLSGEAGSFVCCMTSFGLILMPGCSGKMSGQKRR